MKVKGTREAWLKRPDLQSPPSATQPTGEFAQRFQRSRPSHSSNSQHGQLPIFFSTEQEADLSAPRRVTSSLKAMRSREGEGSTDASSTGAVRALGSGAPVDLRRSACDREHLHDALCRCLIGGEADSKPSDRPRNISSTNDAGHEGGLDGSTLAATTYSWCSALSSW